MLSTLAFFLPEMNKNSRKMAQKTEKGQEIVWKHNRLFAGLHSIFSLKTRRVVSFSLLVAPPHSFFFFFFFFCLQRPTAASADLSSSSSDLADSDIDEVHMGNHDANTEIDDMQGSALLLPSPMPPPAESNSTRARRRQKAQDSLPVASLVTPPRAAQSKGVYQPLPPTQIVPSTPGLEPRAPTLPEVALKTNLTQKVFAASFLEAERPPTTPNGGAVFVSSETVTSFRRIARFGIHLCSYREKIFFECRCCKATMTGVLREAIQHMFGKVRPPGNEAVTKNSQVLDMVRFKFHEEFAAVVKEGSLLLDFDVFSQLTNRAAELDSIMLAKWESCTVQEKKSRVAFTVPDHWAKWGSAIKMVERETNLQNRFRSTNRAEPIPPPTSLMLLTPTTSSDLSSSVSRVGRPLVLGSDLAARMVLVTSLMGYGIPFSFVESALFAMKTIPNIGPDTAEALVPDVISQSTGDLAVALTAETTYGKLVVAHDAGQFVGSKPVQLFNVFFLQKTPEAYSWKLRMNCLDAVEPSGSLTGTNMFTLLNNAFSKLKMEDVAPHSLHPGWKSRMFAVISDNCDANGVCDRLLANDLECSDAPPFSLPCMPHMIALSVDRVEKNFFSVPNNLLSSIREALGSPFGQIAYEQMLALVVPQARYEWTKNWKLLRHISNVRWFVVVESFFKVFHQMFVAKIHLPNGEMQIPNATLVSGGVCGDEVLQAGIGVGLVDFHHRLEISGALVETTSAIGAVLSCPDTLFQIGCAMAVMCDVLVPLARVCYFLESAAFLSPVVSDTMETVKVFLEQLETQWNTAVVDETNVWIHCELLVAANGATRLFGRNFNAMQQAKQEGVKVARAFMDIIHKHFSPFQKLYEACSFVLPEKIASLVKLANKSLSTTTEKVLKRQLHVMELTDKQKENYLLTDLDNRFSAIFSILNPHLPAPGELEFAKAALKIAEKHLRSPFLEGQDLVEWYSDAGFGIFQDVLCLAQLVQVQNATCERVLASFASVFKTSQGRMMCDRACAMARIRLSGDHVQEGRKREAARFQPSGMVPEIPKFKEPKKFECRQE